MYDDIINVNYPIKLKHQRMERCDRASQFMPFAALTGYAQSINEAGRLVDKKQELTDDEKIIISDKINYLIDNKDKNYEAFIVYFIPDLKKDGGKYLSICGVIKKLDVVNRFIKLNNKKIFIDDIISINCSIFDKIIDN